MLQSLHVKNFAIIDETEVNFGDHLNILTGETGAGKSILIGSINAALGAKVSKDIIRKGENYALVELTFDTLSEKAVKVLEEKEIYAEDGVVCISRKIMDNGKSICRVNGETTSQATIKSIASALLDIHGQNEHQSLLKKSTHMDMVDKYAGKELVELKKQMALNYNEYKELKKQLASENTDEETRNREKSFLEFELNEIEGAKLKKGEDTDLEELYKKLSNSRQIEEGIAEAQRFTADDEDGNISMLLSKTVKALSRISEYDKRIEEILSGFYDAESIISDLSLQLGDYAADFEDNEEEFERVSDRLDLINKLKSKYGGSIESILKYCSECKVKIAKYEDYDRYIEEMEEKMSELRKKMNKLAGKITEIRKNKALELTQKIEAACKDLNFLDTRFTMEFEKLTDFTADGIDEGEFMISMNPGESIKPLTQIASGGELSRIMLAIKSVLADEDDIFTLIFDEIDVGISGRTAQKVSEKLSSIARGHQVICITHLPQIAAMADEHFVIEKTSTAEKTYTSIRELDKEHSYEELARIIGGAEITETVLKNAKEMKELADKTKKY